MKRFAPWILIALLALAAVAGWSVYSAKQAVKQALEAVEDLQVDVSMQGVELSRGAEGRTEWRLVADGARYAQDTGLAQVDNPRIVYYLGETGGEAGGDDQRIVEVNATSGEVDQESGGARLWPDVAITSGSTLVLAERLDYDGAQRSIVLTGTVRMMRPGLSLVAPKVTMDLKTSDIFAEGGVVSTLGDAPATEAKE